MGDALMDNNSTKDQGIAVTSQRATDLVTPDTNKAPVCDDSSSKVDCSHDASKFIVDKCSSTLIALPTTVHKKDDGREAVGLISKDKGKKVSSEIFENDGLGKDRLAVQSLDGQEIGSVKSLPPSHSEADPKDSTNVKELAHHHSIPQGSIRGTEIRRRALQIDTDVSNPLKTSYANCEDSSYPSSLVDFIESDDMTVPCTDKLFVNSDRNYLVTPTDYPLLNELLPFQTHPNSFLPYVANTVLNSEKLTIAVLFLHLYVMLQ